MWAECSWQQKERERKADTDTNTIPYLLILTKDGQEEADLLYFERVACGFHVESMLQRGRGGQR
jgi:hypothetical protein